MEDNVITYISNNEEIPSWPQEDGEKTVAAPGTNWKQTILLSLSLLLLCAAIAIAAYPFLSDRFSAWQASQQYQEMSDAYTVADAEKIEDMRDEAEKYNAKLAGDNLDIEVKTYEELLNFDDTGILCWIEIPKLGILDPVYAASDEDGMNQALMEGAAHVKGTSLPVGAGSYGSSANTSITGHSGMRNTRMFDQIDQLENGDIIILWTMGQPYAYKVKDKELVLPKDTQVMKITTGQDECTLITCRPIGVNSHRLIVHAERTDYDVSMGENKDLSYLAEPRLLWFIGALIGTGLLIWWLLFLLARKRHVWWLNRILGAREMSTEDVIEYSEQLDCDMKLELKLFRRARITLFGSEVLKGKWRRVKDERSRILLEWDEDTMGDSLIVCSEDFELFDKIRMPNGEYEAVCLDKELGIDVDYCTSKLVFSRKKPEKNE